jgi:hypothetical protein
MINPIDRGWREAMAMLLPRNRPMRQIWKWRTVAAPKWRSLVAIPGTHGVAITVVAHDLLALALVLVVVRRSRRNHRGA